MESDLPPERLTPNCLPLSIVFCSAPGEIPQQRYQNCVELVTQIDSALRYPKLSWKVGYATITLSACLAVGVGILGYRKLVSRPDLTSPPRAEVASVRPAITNPTIQSFTVEPLSIEAGSVARLSWRVSDATGVEIDHGLGSVPSVGIAAVALLNQPLTSSLHPATDLRFTPPWLSR